MCYPPPVLQHNFCRTLPPWLIFFLFRFFYVFYPLTGIVGLNNIKANDYLNVVLQVRMMVALNSLAPMIWFRILPTGCHTFLCLSTKRVKCPVKASLSIHISNVMEFVLSYFKEKFLITHFWKFKGVKDTLLNGKQFKRVLYMYYFSHYQLLSLTLYYLLLVVYGVILLFLSLSCIVLF